MRTFTLFAVTMLLALPAVVDAGEEPAKETGEAA